MPTGTRGIVFIILLSVTLMGLVVLDQVAQHRPSPSAEAELREFSGTDSLSTGTPPSENYPKPEKKPGLNSGLTGVM